MITVNNSLDFDENKRLFQYLLNNLKRGSTVSVEILFEHEDTGYNCRDLNSPPPDTKRITILTIEDYI